ncbi:Glu/Leu/Phe/Val dehydrogenase dimerization domain-containing protein [Streptomyces yokosukanensis]|uniref:Glu/Leu/Phe/Val dehydrogenase dimerization domain-containing protein n=1 Tax=Streptomyces yokosukanensis TaxID=67386 RepID=UPI00342E7BEC
MLDHEQVVIRVGRRSGLPVISAVHSTALGPAAGGLRLWHYPHWREGLTDALRLSAGMTLKMAVAGLPSGGGKTVVALPEGTRLAPDRRRAVLRDVADVIASLDGAYATGPDVGTGPDDMAVIGESTPYVFCRPEGSGGSGDSSPHTALGTLAALRAVCRHLYGTPVLAGRRLAVVGLGRVGGHLARLLAAEGAALTVTDIDPGRRAAADALGAVWRGPREILGDDVDILVPAALGSLLTREAVPRLRCRAVVGPANNQLATPDVADLMRRHDIVWVPDYVAGAGGVVHAVSTELHRAGPDEARARVLAVERTVTELLGTAEREGVTPAQAAAETARRRLHAASDRPRAQLPGTLALPRRSPAGTSRPVHRKAQAPLQLLGHGGTMTTAIDHYEHLLAEHYTWMLGGDMTAVAEGQARLLGELGVRPGAAGTRAADLGCGPGPQSLALASLGFSPVLAVDTSEPLLAELTDLAKGAGHASAIRPVHADIRTALTAHAEPSSLAAVVCMGDTLTHLPSASDVAAMLADAARCLAPGGQLVLSHRDLTLPRTGTDRFLPVRATEDRIMTCALEYVDDDTVMVHDLIHTRAGTAWDLRVSAYPKLRLGPARIVDWCQDLGLDVRHSAEGPRGLHIVVAVKP